MARRGQAPLRYQRCSAGLPSGRSPLTPAPVSLPLPARTRRYAYRQYRLRRDSTRSMLDMEQAAQFKEHYVVTQVRCRRLWWCLRRRWCRRRCCRRAAANIVPCAAHSLTRCLTRMRHLSPLPSQVGSTPVA